MICPVLDSFSCYRIPGCLTLLLCILSMCLGCSDSEIELTATKKSVAYCSQELWHLYSPGTSEELYTSWTPQDNSIETRSICIPRTSNLQYDFKATNGTDSWNLESYLELVNIYGNRVFKSPSGTGLLRLSLLYPIEKGDSWVWRSDFTKDWTISEEGWSRPSSFPSSSVHYVRQTFDGMSNMASYEVRFWYRYGIVAYINGIEIYRDNMPEGPILSTTEHTSNSSSYDYRGTIRNGFECSSAGSILAVEIHQPSDSPFSYDSWLALYGSSLGNEFPNLCYPIPLGDISDQDGKNMSFVAEFDFSKYANYNVFDPDTTYLEFTVPSSQIVSFTHYVEPYRGFFSQFRVSIKNRITNEFDYSNITTLLENPSSLLYSVYFMFPNVPNTNTIRFYPQKASMLPAWITQMRLYSCYFEYSVQKAVLGYSEQYSLYINEVISIKPRNAGSFSCKLMNPLPDGLILNGCSIEGTPTTLQSLTEYEIYYYDYMGTRIQPINLAVITRETKQETKSFPTVIIVILVLIIVVIALVFLRKWCKISKELPVVEVTVTDLEMSTVNPIQVSTNTNSGAFSISPGTQQESHGQLTPVKQADGSLTPVKQTDGYLIPVKQADGYLIPVKQTDGYLIPVKQADGYLAPVMKPTSSSGYKQPVIEGAIQYSYPPKDGFKGVVTNQQIQGLNQ